MKVTRLVELNELVYQNGGYITRKLMVNLDEISSIRQEHGCSDATVIVMKSGTKYSVQEDYDEVRELVVEVGNGN